MGDTKRGRERKGRTKREQRDRYHIRRTLEARNRERDFEELYEETELELDI
ncbi:hypothetical protein KM295_00140 [Natronomonas sp. F2-12]|jgi:hypothetical protein|uniref:Uncharacterized protein n=1 Tax=Natronomonas aquatica TaxID=2841590 RepID=A0A9R1D4G4_9EURY|nr:hypothetical protein [Natronomonas aquatica]MCQ4331916.1 hypothetical protein [Natronomonas aquatica]